MANLLRHCACNALQPRLVETPVEIEEPNQAAHGSPVSPVQRQSRHQTTNCVIPAQIFASRVVGSLPRMTAWNAHRHPILREYSSSKPRHNWYAHLLSTRRLANGENMDRRRHSEGT